MGQGRGRLGVALVAAAVVLTAGVVPAGAAGPGDVVRSGAVGATTVSSSGAVVTSPGEDGEPLDAPPGEPDWPGGPPPGSGYEPELAGDGTHASGGTTGNVPAGGAAAVRNEVPTARLAGTNRFATAVAISRRAFPRGAETVYLTNGRLLVDAQAAGALTDGPVLLVPGCSGVPSVVAEEIARVAPQRVVAIGGWRSVCNATLEAAAGERETERLAGANRYETAARIAERAFPEGAATVYLANGEGDWSPDALVGGTLADGPVLLVNRRSAPAATVETLEALAPSAVVALGGELAVPERVLAQAAGTLPTERVAGADRYATAAAVASRAFGEQEATAYLARGDSPADAVAGGILTDGPILLAPPDCRVLPEPTWRHLGRSTPDRVIALGGTSAICGQQLSTGARLSTFTALERVRDGHLLDLITKTRTVSPLRHEPGDLVAFRGGQHRLRGEVSQQLDALFREAAAQGHRQLHVTSGYRSYDTQAATYDYWVRVLGKKEADRVSARAGHSEHQLGQAVDIWGRSCSGRECFGSTPEGRWVAANAHRWGFIVRYPRAGEPVTGYAYEPWHLRYVGPRAAWMMKVRGEIYWDHYRAQAVRDSRGF